MKAIVAVDERWGIGKDNGLMFSVPEDMKFFRRITTGKVIIVGRKTLESFPGGAPLKNRINVVMSRSLNVEGATVVNSKEQLMREIGGFPPDDVYVCGGASVYSELLPYCTHALVTKISAIGNADVFFPNLDRAEGWTVESVSEQTVSNGYSIKFYTYKNNNVKEL